MGLLLFPSGFLRGWVGGTKACSDGGGAELEHEDEESLQRETGAWEGRVAAGTETLPGSACGPIPQALVQTPGFVTG